MGSRSLGALDQVLLHCFQKVGTGDGCAHSVPAARAAPPGSTYGGRTAPAGSTIAPTGST